MFFSILAVKVISIKSSLSFLAGSACCFHLLSTVTFHHIQFVCFFYKAQRIPRDDGMGLILVLMSSKMCVGEIKKIKFTKLVIIDMSFHQLSIYTPAGCFCADTGFANGIGLD